MYDSINVVDGFIGKSFRAYVRVRPIPPRIQMPELVVAATLPYRISRKPL
jgi:hypothetical protein